jgi:hypothetical protein
MTAGRPDKPDPGTLVRLWTRITARVVDHGFALGYSRLDRPRLGIFDGLKITLDPAVEFEMQCFLVLHLFGHSVQWVAPTYQPEIAGVSEGDLDVYLEALERYERAAARFGLGLMHECGVHDIDQWYFDFAEADWRYVETFYRTGEIPAWESCIVRCARPVESWNIPPLEPRPVEVRYAF